MSVATQFPIPLHEYKVVALNPAQPALTAEQRRQLQSNIQLCRDAIVFFTAVADAKGLGGHTGGPYDTVPEVMIMHGFMQHARNGGSPDVLPTRTSKNRATIFSGPDHSTRRLGSTSHSSSGSTSSSSSITRMTWAFANSCFLLSVSRRRFWASVRISAWKCPTTVSITYGFVSS